MDTKQQLLRIRECNVEYDHREDGVNYNRLCLAALAQIERLEKIDFPVQGSRAEVPRYMVIPYVSVTNLARCLRWHPQGLDSWSLSDWAVALSGEVGELCNVIKKLNRVRDGLPGNKESPDELRANLGPEIADVYLYLDLLAQRAGLVLEECIRDKFNATSQRVGFPERL